MDFGYYNMDCMDGMKEFPDGYFDLAIVDPPYGLHEHGGKNRNTFVKQKNGTKTYVGKSGPENRGRLHSGGLWPYIGGICRFWRRNAGYLLAGGGKPDRAYDWRRVACGSGGHARVYVLL